MASRADRSHRAGIGARPVPGLAGPSLAGVILAVALMAAGTVQAQTGAAPAPINDLTAALPPARTGSADAAFGDIAFLPGGRLGLVPPAGLKPSRRFPGFEDPVTGTTLQLTEMRPGAFAELSANFTAEALSRNGFTLEHRRDLALPGGEAFLLTGRMEAPGAAARRHVLIAALAGLTGVVTFTVPAAGGASYDDAVAERTLASLSVRPAPSLEERLAETSFRVGALAGFKPVSAHFGNSVLLSDGDVADLGRAGHGEAMVLVTHIQGAPVAPDDRATFARKLLVGTEGFKGVRIDRMETLRVRGTPGHEIIAGARDARTDKPVKLVQWFRFERTGALRIVGVVPEERWDAAYPRFRAVRDGVELR